MTNERAIQILENLISINGDIIIGDEGREALEMAIRSLQQERQEVDLEKEIKDTCRRYWINDFHEQELGKRDIENIAHHFYELGKNSK